MAACDALKENVTNEAGFSLVELLLTLLFISLTILPVMRAYFVAEKEMYYSNQEVTAVQLAQDMMEEITSLPFKDGDVAGTFGLEEDISSPVEGRMNFDDIDDYDIYSHDYGGHKAWGWQSPPRDIRGKPILAASQFSRMVAVWPVNSPDYSHTTMRKTSVTSDPNAAFKLVEVKVKWKGDSVVLQRIVADTTSVPVAGKKPYGLGKKKGKKHH